jgi:hypothetical protein
LGPKTKLRTQNFEICKFKGLLQIPNFECCFEFLSVQYNESIFTRSTSESDFLNTFVHQIDTSECAKTTGSDLFQGFPTQNVTAH